MSQLTAIQSAETLAALRALAVSEREPTLFVAFVILFACFEVFFFGVLGALGQSIAGALKE